MASLPVWLQLLGLITAALGGILGGIAAIRQARTAVCVAREDSERREEDARREALDQVVHTLSADYNRLVEAQRIQQAAQDGLQDEVRTLAAENAELREELNRLQHKYELLAAEHARLKAEYVRLKAEYEHIQSEHARVATWARKRGYGDDAAT